MKVLLVDDHPLFLAGLRNLLTAHGVEVLGTARDGLDALEQARALRPEVILLDIQMPQLNGLAALRLIKAEFPEMRVVMLTMSAEEADLFEAIKSGACGYLLKTQDTDEFFALLQDAADGKVALSAELAARVLQEFSRQANTVSSPEDKALHAGLSPREIEVLTLVAQGLTYKEVGAKLALTERTIKYHMGEIVRRLHAENRAQVIAYARQTGLVRWPP